MSKVKASMFSLRLLVPKSLAFGMMLLFSISLFAQKVASPLELAGYDRLLCVKFKDDLPVFAENGRLTDRGAGILAPLGSVLEAGFFTKMIGLDDPILDDMRYQAQIFWENAAKEDVSLNPGRMADLNRYFVLLLNEGVNKAELMRTFQESPLIEHIAMMPKPVTPPTPGNYLSNQKYLTNDYGINANQVYSTYNNRGSGIKVVDIEGAFNPNHGDLPGISLVSGTYMDDPNDHNHGTAVLGEMVSKNNGWGTTGIASSGTAMFAGVNDQFGYYNVANAITKASNAIQPGDVILIEQHNPGPYSNGNGQFGYVPMEYFKVCYDAIKIAVGNNRIVVEAAGNGYQNLEAPLNYKGNVNHYPFTTANNSGAIMIGAGYAETTGSVNARSRMDYSNYGPRVDVQAFGEKVWTTGMGDAYGAEGINYWYTANFSGTSSASPIVAGACMLIQSMHKSLKNGAILSPLQMRSLLVSTGKAQQSGPNPTSQKIGPLPNAYAAIQTFAQTSACSAPTTTQLSATNITATSAQLNCGVNGVERYDWAYRQVGGSTWTDLVSTTTNNISVSGLQANKQYEFVAAVRCNGGTWSDWSATKTFNTGSTGGSAPVNDPVCNATQITAGSSCSYTSGTTSGATPTFTDGMCGTNNPKDVWYKCVIPSTGKVTFRTTAGSLTDALMAVFWGSGCTSLNYVACEDDNDNGNGSYMPVMTITGQPGTQLWVRIWGYNNTGGTFNICAMNYSTANFNGEPDGPVYHIDPTQSQPYPADGVRLDDTESLVNRDEAAEKPDMGAIGKVYPNPATGLVTLPLNLQEESGVEVMISDVLGSVVYRRQWTEMAGEHQAALDLGALQPGIYSLRCSSGGLTQVLQLQIIR